MQVSGPDRAREAWDFLTGKEHDWQRDVRKDMPVLVCSRCPIVWWPDRNKPKSTCPG